MRGPLSVCLLLTLSAQLSHSSDDHDDYRHPSTCLVPGECDSDLNGPSTSSSIRLVQLLSGRDHAIPSTAKTAQQKQLFQQAKAMVNFQYLVGDKATNEVVVVDGAWDPVGIQTYVANAGLKLVGYVATHYHYDHIGSQAGHGSPPAPHTIPGIAYFVDTMKLPAYIHNVELQRALGWTQIRNDSSVQPIEDGFVLKLNGVSMTFLHTPGHSPGGLSLLLSVNGRDEMVITGDTLFPGSCGRVDLPGSDKKEMHHSLQQVLAKLPGHLIVWPGHGYSRSSSTVRNEKVSGLLRPIEMRQWLQMMR